MLFIASEGSGDKKIVLKKQSDRQRNRQTDWQADFLLFSSFFYVNCF